MATTGGRNMERKNYLCAAAGN